MAQRINGPLFGTSVHVIQRGHNKMAVLEDLCDFEWFLSYLRDAADRRRVDLHGYALMTTHVHLVVTPQEPESLPRMMQTLGARYTRHFNIGRQRIGSAWNGRYRATDLSNEQYALTCLRYVDQNPVRAGMVKRPEQYAWTSYAAHAFGNWPEWLVPHPAYMGLGLTPERRQAAYRSLCGDAVPDHQAAALRLARIHPILPADLAVAATQ